MCRRWPAALICATFPRSYLDPNRLASDVDATMLDGPWPHPASPSPRCIEQGNGLIWRLTPEYLPIYARRLSPMRCFADLQGTGPDPHLRPARGQPAQPADRDQPTTGSSLLSKAAIVLERIFQDSFKRRAQTLVGDNRRARLVNLVTQCSRLLTTASRLRGVTCCRFPAAFTFDGRSKRVEHEQ